METKHVLQAFTVGVSGDGFRGPAGWVEPARGKTMALQWLHHIHFAPAGNPEELGIHHSPTGADRRGVGLCLLAGQGMRERTWGFP